MSVLWLVPACSIILVACPEDPTFVASDVAETTSDTTTAPTDSAATEVEVEASRGTPCEHDCIVQVSDDETVAFDAVVDASGRATVLVFRSPGPNQHHLAMRRWVAADAAWELTTLSSSIVEPVQLAVGLDPDGAMHVLAEVGFGLIGGTTWFRDVGGEWLSGTLVPGRRCLGPSVEGMSDRLVATCVDPDELELVFLRLERDELGLGWREAAVLPDFGWVSRLDLPQFHPHGWAIDVLGRPHAAWSCCGSEATVRYAWWDGARWRESELATPMVAPGVAGRSVRLALDAAGHPHVLHQQEVESVGELVDRAFESTWGSEVLARAELAGEAVAELLEIAADARGRLHLVYQLGSSLLYRVYDDGWSSSVTSTVEVDGSVRRIALVVDGDAAHVVFADPAGALWWWTPAAPLVPASEDE